VPQEKVGDKMNLTRNDEILIRLYLLGKVIDQEQEQIEQQLMTDSQYFGHFLKTEESLIDEYVKGKLSSDERESFETHFLSAPERRDKLAFAKSLNRYIAEAKTSQSADVGGADNEAARSRKAIFWPRLIHSRAAIAVIIIAALALITSAIILLTENARLRERIVEQQASLNRSEEESRQRLGKEMERNKELARQLEQSQNEIFRTEQEMSRYKQENGRHREIAASGIASLIIAPGSVRDTGQSYRMDLANHIQRLRLELRLEGENYESYRAEVETVEGKSIWKAANLRARQGAREKTIVTTLPARQLLEGDYLVTLSAAIAGGGYEEVATYFFTILRD
jgi:hypothetical protein